MLNIDNLMNDTNFGSNLNELPKNIIYMKYGTHVSEKPDDIIRRKIEECNHQGMSFWGYGGNLCHPINQVQPFIKENLERGEKTYLVLSRTTSVYNGYPSRATFYSADKISWKEIPIGINVLGSPLAIICRNMEMCNFLLDLADYEVPVGNSAGKILSQILSWHINKSCGRLIQKDYYNLMPVRPVKISVIAEIERAVFVC